MALLSLRDLSLTFPFALSSVLLLASAVHAEAPPEMATITANVGPLRSAKGSVACRLYASSKGFPRTAEGTTTQRVKVTGTRATCTFAGVKPGTYAVMVHHDENDNRKFDRNVLGLPLEGYGASNNHTPALSAPSWGDSKFSVERGASRSLAIGLRY
jgi:uncharacterized protein (DUF2141 family)